MTITDNILSVVAEVRRRYKRAYEACRSEKAHNHNVCCYGISVNRRIDCYSMQSSAGRSAEESAGVWECCKRNASDENEGEVSASQKRLSDGWHQQPCAMPMEMEMEKRIKNHRKPVAPEA